MVPVKEIIDNSYAVGTFNDINCTSLNLNFGFIEADGNGSVSYIKQDGTNIVEDNFSTFDFTGEFYINRTNDTFWIYIPEITLNLSGNGSSLNSTFNQHIADELNRRNTYEIGQLNSD